MHPCLLCRFCTVQPLPPSSHTHMRTHTQKQTGKDCPAYGPHGIRDQDAVGRMPNIQNTHTSDARTQTHTATHAFVTQESKEQAAADTKDLYRELNKVTHKHVTDTHTFISQHTYTYTYHLRIHTHLQPRTHTHLHARIHTPTQRWWASQPTWPTRSTRRGGAITTSTDAQTVT